MALQLRSVQKPALTKVGFCASGCSIYAAMAETTYPVATLILGAVNAHIRGAGCGDRLAAQ